MAACELALAAVDQDEVGQLLALLQQPPVAAAHHLAHRREVVRRTGHAAHAELPVVRLLGQPVLEAHHRRDDVRALDVRDVEALDAPRLHLQVQHVAQRAQDLLRLAAGMPPFQVEGQPRVAQHHLQQPDLLAPLGHADVDDSPRRSDSHCSSSAWSGTAAGTSTSRGHLAPLRVELLDRGRQEAVGLGQGLLEEALARHDAYRRARRTPARPRGRPPRASRTGHGRPAPGW